ncbi:MAG: hypothetical protein ABSC19_18350 [Syntrophorhabdales bacterium]|jgi:hypothetical protein
MREEGMKKVRLIVMLLVLGATLLAAAGCSTGGCSFRQKTPTGQTDYYEPGPSRSAGR